MFEIGQKIGPYVLERSLGEGSYGVVWLAEERTGLIQRHVALKLPKDYEPDIEAIRKEADAWLRAGKHHNIVQVLHADIYDGQVAIATEFVPGGSLHDWLRRRNGAPVEPAYAVEMARGILSGLQHLHSLPPKPLVHRDLKPGNVLLKGDTPLLTDFGLTRVFSSTAFTQAGGTPAYMPPEAFDDRFSPQTDIWAAGVTLYRMLKGELPFPQREFSALIGAILHKEPEPLPEDVPWSIRAVTLKAMMKDPERRFGSAEEMREALGEAMEAAKRGETTEAPPTPTVSSIPLTPWAQSEAPGMFDLSMTRPTAPAPTPGFSPDRGRRPEFTVPPIPQPYLHALGAPRGALEHRSPAMSEALTAVPEPRAAARTRTGLERFDAMLLRLSGNTTTFCLSLLAALPVWAAFGGVVSMLEHIRGLDTLPPVFLLAGVTSVVFARLAWHRYASMPAGERKKTAIRYAVLGLFSGTVVPIVAIVFYLALASATRPAEAPPEAAAREIESPRA